MADVHNPSSFIPCEVDIRLASVSLANDHTYSISCLIGFHIPPSLGVCLTHIPYRVAIQLRVCRCVFSRLWVSCPCTEKHLFHN